MTRLISSTDSEKTNKRFALLLAARDSEYVIDKYGGYFNVFVSAFGEEDESWDLYRVVDGEFPAVDDLDTYDGFVISGSPFDAYSNEIWIIKLCILLRVLDAMEKRVLGICFGHQVICRALGGKVAKSVTGWDIGLRGVNLQTQLLPSRLQSALMENEDDDNDDQTVTQFPASLSIIKIHQDEVWEVPPEAKVIASSDKTGVEMYTIEDHIMGIQGHPEYTQDILLNLIDRLRANNSIQLEFADNARLTFQNAQPDRKHLHKLCKTFLKR